MADWKKIKTEYITTDISYRDLAKKHGIHYQTICRRSKAEGWIDQREQHTRKTVTKTINAISDKQVDRGARLASVADKLLARVSELIEDNPIMLSNPQNLKHISGVLKDLKDVQMIKSDMDLREQEARIANLRKQADMEEKQLPTIIVEGLPEEFKV